MVRPDGETASHETAEETVSRVVAGGQLVAVGDVDRASLHLKGERLVADTDPDVAGEEFADPEVVVTGDVEDLQALPGDGGELGEDADVGPGEDLLVLEPEIEEVADDVEDLRPAGGEAQKLDEPIEALLFRLLAAVAEVGVRHEQDRPPPGASSMRWSRQFLPIVDRGMVAFAQFPRQRLSAAAADGETTLEVNAMEEKKDNIEDAVVEEVADERKESAPDGDAGGETGGPGEEARSREVPPPSSDETIWTKVRKGLKDGYSYAADKTDLYTRIGKRRLGIIGINRNIDRSFNELGEKVYNILAAGGDTKVEGDLAVGELFEKIRKLEGELTAKEAEIERILQESRSSE